MMPTFARDEVTISRAPYVVERGTKVRDWQKAESHKEMGCSFQPVSSATSWSDPRQAQTIRATLYLPASADIQAEDLVEFDGTTYAIDGVPHLWRSPSGRIEHKSAALIDWEG